MQSVLTSVVVVVAKELLLLVALPPNIWPDATLTGITRASHSAHKPFCNVESS
jgi:hypothetical protein